MAGRPSGFTQEIADCICARLAGGESLRAICRDDDMPSRQTVANWLAKDADFFGQYARARDVALDDMADELLEIADDGSNDWMIRKNADGSDGPEVLNGEHVQRSKLRVDTRKWVLSKLAAKKYGDKLALEHGGVDGAPLVPILNVYCSTDRPQASPEAD
jgi:hypothetical protein